MAKAKAKAKKAKSGSGASVRAVKKTMAAARKAKPKHAKRVTPIKQSSKPAKKAAHKPAKPSAAKSSSSKRPPVKPAKPAAAKKALPQQSVSRKSPAKSEQQQASKAVTKPARHNDRSAHGVAVAAPGSEPTITKEDGRYALPATVNIDLPKGYRPSPKEEYMGPKQLAYFRNKLREWREQLVEESRQTMENLREEVRDVGDDAERATRETENSLELRTRDRYRKLISKIDKALRRIEEGRYGYCEETDEEIGLERLEARPIATLSLDAQERREHLQKQMGD